MLADPSRNLAAFLSRHLVGIVALHDHYIRQPFEFRSFDAKAFEADAASGFVMEHRGHWFLLTAGHVIRGLDDRLKKPNTELRVQLIDSFHSGAKHKQPLNLPYETLIRRSVGNEKDVDYGFIVLNSLTVPSLQANGIVPVTLENWGDAPKIFERYYLVGMPGELVELNRDVYPHQVRATQAGALHVRKIDEVPEGFGPGADRFFGEVDLRPVVKGQPRINSVEGMSGCPLLGMNISGEKPQYWFHAIQSGWNEGSKIMACPFRPFAKLLQEALDLVLDTPETAAGTESA